jgi:hypothetical protein
MSDFALKASSCGARRKMLEELFEHYRVNWCMAGRFCWGIAFAAPSVIGPNTWKSAFPSQPISGASRDRAWITGKPDTIAQSVSRPSLSPRVVSTMSDGSWFH